MNNHTLFLIKEKHEAKIQEETKKLSLLIKQKLYLITTLTNFEEQIKTTHLANVIQGLNTAKNHIIQNNYSYINNLYNEIEKIKLSITQIEQKIINTQNLINLEKNKIKSFEILIDNNNKKENQKEAKKEQKMLDEISIQKFINKEDN